MPIEPGHDVSIPPRTRIVPIAALAALTAIGTACTPGDGLAPVGTGDAARGEQLFANNCATCHGPVGQGTTTGPPLVHELYVPSHHGDAAFLLAVRNGVQPHHWSFGPMPPMGSLDAEDVNDIVAWVRQLQRQADLID